MLLDVTCSLCTNKDTSEIVEKNRPYRSLHPHTTKEAEDLLRQVGSRGCLCLHAARLQVQARDATGQGNAELSGSVSWTASMVEEAAGRASAAAVTGTAGAEQ